MVKVVAAYVSTVLLHDVQPCHLTSFFSELCKLLSVRGERCAGVVWKHSIQHGLNVPTLYKKERHETCCLLDGSIVRERNVQEDLIPHFMQTSIYMDNISAIVLSANDQPRNALRGPI